MGKKVKPTKGKPRKATGDGKKLIVFTGDYKKSPDAIEADVYERVRDFLEEIYAETGISQYSLLGITHSVLTVDEFLIGGDAGDVRDE